MLNIKIIKKLIGIIEETGQNNFISSEYLKFDDLDDDKFINQINSLEGLVDIRNKTHIKYPLIKLTPKGVIFCKECIDFEEIYNVVSLKIKPMCSSFEISEELKIPKVFVDAVFVDLNDNNLIKIKSNCGDLLVLKITEKGIEYFNNLK